MSKEIYISTTPHETRLAIVENDALTEIYYERENEYTLAGSIYNGRVTRVLPGMQSAFVDIGLERDAFLYITDFMEEVPDAAEFDTSSNGDHRPRLSAGEQTPSGQPALERSGERSGERGGRGRRGGRDRDRGERSPSPVPADPAQPYAAEPYADSAADLGQPLSEATESSSEGHPGAEAGAEGSRRWRGRRGRRRGGRTNAPQSAEAPQPGAAAQGSFGEGETLYEGGSDFDEAAAYDIGASAEPGHPIDAAPSSEPSRDGERREGRRDRGRFDRGRRGRDRRGESPASQQPGAASPDQSLEPRQDAPQRYPRGFAPSRNLYGVEDPELPAAGAESLSEPIILPGESLSKYRRPGEQEPERSSASTATPLSLAPPASLYTVAAGWDGGDVLPGETLSRRRPAEASASRSDRPSQSFAGQRERSPRRNERRESTPAFENTSLAQPESTPFHPAPEDTHVATSFAAADVAFEQPPVHASQSFEAAAPTHEEHAAQPLPEPAPTAEPAAIHEQAEPAEYEPTDAGVSYRVDPVSPAEYRQSSPTLEPASEPEAHPEASLQEAHEAAREEHTAEPAVEYSASLTHSITPAPGEPLAPIQMEPAPTAHEHIEPATAAHTEAAADQSSPAESHDFTSISATGNMHSHTETADAPRTLEVAEPADPASPLPTHSAGVDEELLEDDDEEPAGPTLHASSFEELDDSEEESLEGSADLGTMLREMSIDSITRVSPDVDGEAEDDFLEDDLEDDFDEEESENDAEMQEQAQEQPGLHEHDSLEHDLHDHDPHDGNFAERAASDTSSAHFDGTESASPASFGTGFDHAAPPESPTIGDPGERRGDRRDDRRGGRRDGRRDGRGGRNDGRSDRGPRTGSPGANQDRGGRGGRQSMQSTNLPAISDLLKPGQEILVQIAKEPIAKKGARITSHIALPGRFLVFMPTVNHTGVSRKIESDAERRRLKEILLSEKGEASGGFIVRTAAAGATEEELRSDLRFLLNLWADVKSRSDSSKSPALIYHDLNLIERILRDQVTDTFSAIWVDSETEYERVLRFLQRFQPSLIRRVKLYSKEMPLFEQFGITEEINKALRSKVWLKSGGSIVINQTEALVAIDINTGKYVGKTARLEDTIVKTNLDAIPEIVRQIRLRDLGGIIIIDFIDMDERKNRNRVMAALEEELKTDRAPSKVLQFNDFGLVAITRKRVKQSLERTLSTPCNVCQGTGMVKSPVTVCNDIYIEMRKMHKHLDRGDVMLRVHPDVVKQLKVAGSKWLQEMEEMSGKTILVKSDPSLHPEQFDIH